MASKQLITAKKVCKFATGEAIPDGAIFLSTQVEKTLRSETFPSGTHEQEEHNRLVWHYFLVEVDSNGVAGLERDIVKVLKENESRLSDGFEYYSDDDDMREIARAIKNIFFPIAADQ